MDKILVTEHLLEKSVAAHRVNAQVPSAFALRLPSAFSIVLRNASTPNEVWPQLANLRSRMVPYRVAHREITSALTAGDSARDQRRARELVNALTSGVPRSAFEQAGDSLLGLGRIMPKIAAAPTAASSSLLLSMVPVAARQSSSLLSGFIRRLLAPELHVLNRISSEAGAALASAEHVQRLWRVDDHQMTYISRILARLANA